jgi:glutamine cyclotransferase
MSTFYRNTLLLCITAIYFIGCKQDNDTGDQSAVAEPELITSLSKSRYALGDSIHIRFADAVADFQVKINGEITEAQGNGLKEGVVISEQNKMGWQQLVVSGTTKETNKAFSDTLRFELVSDMVPRELTYSVTGSFPHLKTSFTQGLEFYNGELYEGTGENGKSKLLKIDLKTGSVLKSLDLDKKYFGEGITIVNDKIYQLTWQSGVCFRYNMDFTLDKVFNYYFQGWGLTHRDTTLMMSDGSNKIHFYNTEYEKTGDLEVYDQNGPVRNINELEYVKGFIYANIFESTKIIKIDANSGKVVASMDMKNMIPAEIDARKDVLNGIAFNTADQSFYVTGKNWPLLFRIKINDKTTDNRRNL